MKQDDVIAEFKRYVDQYVIDHKCYGMRGYEDEPVAFVPRCALVTFWTTDNVRRVFYSREDWIRDSTSTIQAHYLHVFSILVYMSQPQHISLFTECFIKDTSLPLDETRFAFLEGEEKRIFEEFHKEQWRFYPFLFETEGGPKQRKLHLPPLQIIPIISKDPIKHSGDVQDDTVCVYRVKLHPLCFAQQEVVFKIYRDVDSEVNQSYENEVDMYTQLDEQASSYDSIIRYFGSFEIPGFRTIVLEYASGGNLKSFFERYPPPLAHSDRILFWDNLMGLLGGLDAIHNLRKSRGVKGAWLLTGTHQDIRPQNILVCPGTSDNISIYAAKFKFADMGTGHIHRARHQGLGLNAQDHSGNGMYSAPEAYRDHGDSTTIQWESDIWSLGGVASEALVWTRWGEYGRIMYQKDRVLETRESPLNGGFHEGAFYDGNPFGACLLNAVDSWHSKAISYAGEESQWLSEIFLVDDSRSMMPHKKKVATSCQVLSYLLKKGGVDPNATFEVYFTSSCHPIQSTRTSKLKESIENMDFLEEQCNMGPSLDEVVSKAIVNPKPVSIYVLTNGHWNLRNQDNFCGVDGPIRRLVTHLKQANAQQNWIGVQFIRFFLDPATAADRIGETRLKALDDDLKRETGM
ncbi:serine/threonine protein kinase [Colletotrichum orchidophilum]|uniref:Serine/threonine protein kinase n=1 Tax=Colletotrichum orchidophilum TaxID=1209926 RepID=A0A1G4BEA4_9PEZI|nr:serine/threonine protein kinase [Colletotrichum orchidophilum]OHE99731.1 serine/threonine protein kinase [Colletotrichum orchidophilum]